MKKLLLISFIIPVLCHSQSYRISQDTVYVNDSITFVKGQYAYLGIGSNANKSFNFIFTNPGSIGGYTTIGAAYSNTHLRIKDIEERGSKKLGHKVYLKLAGGNLVNYYCDITAALEVGELKPNSQETQ